MGGLGVSVPAQGRRPRFESRPGASCGAADHFVVLYKICMNKIIKTKAQCRWAAKKQAKLKTYKILLN